MQNKERNQQEQLVEKAKAYFDAHGLSTSLEAFFAKEEVKLLIHEKYASFEDSVNEIVTETDDSELPEFIIERARSAAETIKGNEDKYADNVKLSVLCSMYNLFEGIESFVTVDDTIAASFKVMFTGNDNAKFMETFNQICDGVISKMTEKLVKLICVPQGLPDEIIDILMMIGGGMPMMNLEEMESMFGSHDGEDDDNDEDAPDVEEGNATC